MSQTEMRLRIASDMDIACAVMQAQKMAEQMGFDDVARCKIATTVSELAQNIRKYAERGCITLRDLQRGTRQGLEISAEDHGPGITDIESAMKDHFSTGGTLGLGLPGVKRLMDEFQMLSEKDRGTRVTVIKWL